MKKVEDMTIQEMVAEHAKLKAKRYKIRYGGQCYIDDVDERLVPLTRALDQKCEEAGIKLWPDDVVSFTKIGDMTTDFVCPKIHATDLHALLGYLLSKQS